MTRYRYRTNVLLGPWRDTAEEAVADALRANQARPEGTVGDILWLVAGRIEAADQARPEDLEPGGL